MISLKKVITLVICLSVFLTTILTGCSVMDDFIIDETKLIYVWWNDSTQDVMQTAINDFRVEYPEYRDYMIVIQTPEIQNIAAIDAAKESNASPSIIKMDYVYTNELGDKGYIEDLSDVKYNFGKHKGKYIEKCWQSTTHEDKIYGIPFDANAIALLYNKNAFAEAKLAPPTNYSELVEAGEALINVSEDNKWSYTLPVNSNDSWTTMIFSIWLWRMGGEILSPDLTEATFNLQPGIDVLKMWQELINKNIVDKNMYHENGFIAENVAMIETGSWLVTKLEKRGAFECGYAELPELKDGVLNYSGLGLYNLAIVSEDAGNKNTELSYKFAEFLCTSPKYQLEYCKSLNLLPSLKECYEDEEYKSGVKSVFAEQMKSAKSRPNVKCWSQIEEIISEAVKSAIKGLKTPEDALNDAAEQVNILLK